MRTVIARIFDYSLDGLIPEEDTEFFQFCRDLPDTPASDAFSEEFEAGADVHIMGRVHYQQMAAAFSDNSDDPFSEMLTAARKVVFSRTLKTADWANTTIIDGDLTEAVDKLRHGGDVYILASGGVGFWRSLARLDLVDEYRVIMVPYLASSGGIRLFDDADRSRRLELLSSTAFDNGMVGLRYRRARAHAAPPGTRTAGT